jgi:hypothetical protein
VNQLHFEIDCEHRLFELYRELVDRSIAFVVEYPVKREISATALFIT